MPKTKCIIAPERYWDVQRDFMVKYFKNLGIVNPDVQEEAAKMALRLTDLSKEIDVILAQGCISEEKVPALEAVQQGMQQYVTSKAHTRTDPNKAIEDMYRVGEAGWELIRPR